MLGFKRKSTIPQQPESTEELRAIARSPGVYLRSPEHAKFREDQGIRAGRAVNFVEHWFSQRGFALPKKSWRRHLPRFADVFVCGTSLYFDYAQMLIGRFRSKWVPRDDHERLQGQHKELLADREMLLGELKRNKTRIEIMGSQLERLLREKS